MRSARNNTKKRDKKERTKKKRIVAEGEPTQAIDARIGDEEKNRKREEEQKKETGSGPPAHLPGPFDRLLRPA